MEEGHVFCIDPEEVEIFFTETTQKEAEAEDIFGENSMQSDVVNSGHNSQGINQSTVISGLKSGFEYRENDPDSKICEDNAKNRSSSSDGTKHLEPNEKEKERSRSEEKDEYRHDVHDNINILIDHSYSIPVKTVIDKSILKTPKSIVKADQDGGFLKVLSEIALVKAEIDENTPTFSDISNKKETTNEDNKENVEQTITVPSKEESPMILIEDLSMKNTIIKNKTEEFSETCGMKNEKAFHIIDCEKDLNKPEEQNLINNKSECASPISSNIIPITEDMVLPTGNALEDSDEIDVVFEKLAISVKKSETVDELTVDNPSDVSDLIKFDSFIDKPTSQGNELYEIEPGTEELKSEEEVKKIQEIIILDDTLPTVAGQKDECIFLGNHESNDDDRHNKFLRRRTMRLLEELSEIVSHDNVRKDVNIGSKCLSEEATKVIQKLKAVAFDDSIESPDQYYDLDNLNDTFISNEVSDLLNDTLSKPLDLLTNKDIALLLERINGTTCEDEFKCQKGIIDANKENLWQTKMKEKLSINTENSKSCKPTMKFASSEKCQKTPVPLKSNVQSQQIIHQKNFTPTSICLSQKKTNQKRLIQSQTSQNTFRVGYRTAEKPKKSNLDTRIPKLSSTTSKLPIRGFIKIQGKTPNKAQKTPKKLKFDNIESPVQAYIKAKTPILISNVKGKSELKSNFLLKQETSNTKTVKPGTEIKVSKNEPKLNLPYVNYRSAIPLKLEKAPESRLPRLAPKMQKLILGNSPTVAKHEIRLQLANPSKSDLNVNDSTITNEVSILVTKSALQRNVNK